MKEPISTRGLKFQGSSMPQVRLNNDRHFITDEDPRVMPYDDSDIELINRVEYEKYFGHLNRR